MGSPLEPAEGTQPCQHLEVSSEKLMYFWRQETGERKLLLYEAIELMVIFFTEATGN